MTTHPILTKLQACREGMTFAQQYPTLQAAWDACTRPDWMLWYACQRPQGEEHRKTFVRIACGCARLALPYAEGDAARLCVETTERWVDGRATLEEVRPARRVAVNAAPTSDLAPVADRMIASAAADAAKSASLAAYAYAYAESAADAAAAAARADCASRRPTVFPAVPTLLRAMVRSELAPAQLSSLRLVISAGAALPAEVAAAAYALAADAKRAEFKAQCCAIIRQHLPTLP